MKLSDDQIILLLVGGFFECYAAYENGKWGKGCSFDKADDFMKAYVMHLITGKDVKSFLSNSTT